MLTSIQNKTMRKFIPLVGAITTLTIFQNNNKCIYCPTDVIKIKKT